MPEEHSPWRAAIRPAVGAAAGYVIVALILHEDSSWSLALRAGIVAVATYLLVIWFIHHQENQF